MYELTNTIEIAFFVILPLIVYFQKSKLKTKVYVWYVIFLYIIWFFTYALLHELMHYFGALITNGDIIDYQLMPEFWKGDVSTGYVMMNFSSPIQKFFICLLPYARDVIFTFIGYFALSTTKIRKHFLRGLILIIFIFSPAFDVFNNFVPYLFGTLNDFNAIRVTTSSFVANTLGSIFLLITLGGVIWVIFSAKLYRVEGSLTNGESR